ncbi:tRNA lysidine(34) synthetase TilS [Peptococcaceae bacterium]|nr:tRNA lysidine(34) synthetase TilS [Peptococcaceae bacterium]
MEIEEKVLNFINSSKMIKSGQKVLVAVSGGVDSVTLLHMLNKWKKILNIALCAAHLDHMFRGEESKKDAEFVQKICDEWRIPCIVERINVPEYMKDKKISAQIAAREVRYNFLERAAGEVNADLIALAHHADDQAETVLLNLIRGSGIRGLSGMDFIRDERYIRPLIQLRRKEIETYCSKYGLLYREDASNKKTIYLRNRIRLNLMPILEEYNPKIVDVFLRLADISRAEDSYILMEAKKAFDLLAEFKSSAVILDRKKFNDLHTAIKRRVANLAWEKVSGMQGLSFEHIENIIKHAKSSAPKIVELPCKVVCNIAYERMKFSVGTEDLLKAPVFHKIAVPGTTIVDDKMTITSSLHYRENFNVALASLPKNEAVLDYHITGAELFVRTRKPGDVFKPLGVGGKVKLKKFFIDQKVPRSERDKIPIICNKKGDIVWVCGFRIGEDFKITHSTKRILHLKLTV